MSKELSEILSEIAEVVRMKRTKLRLSQEQLAEKAGVSSIFICNIENNKLESITLSKLKNITDALSLNLNITCK